MNIKLAIFTDFWIYLAAMILLSVLVLSCRTKENKSDTEDGESKVYGVFVKKVFQAREGTLNYRILYPTGFEADKKYPLLLFLHGAGERGSDNKAQLKHGGELIRKEMERHNSIAIFPQCPTEDYWIELVDSEIRPDGVRNFVPDVQNPPSAALDKVMQLIESYLQESYIDKSRIYVSGLSMGGMGTFDLCWRMPKTFAAANAICGAGAPEKAKDFAGLPIRIFHGTEDKVVSVEESLEMIEALREAGGNPQSFIYPEVKHNSWDNAFAEPDFIAWLFEHQRH